MLFLQDEFTMHSLSKKYLIIIGAALFFVGGFFGSFWHSLSRPMKPLYVELFNDTKEIIPSVEIEHGSVALQEKILVVRLEPQERRIIALNHKPGMGFNVAVNYANREKTEICAGKSKDYWFFRETITKFGVYSTPIR